jgi:hypothetical protein
MGLLSLWITCTSDAIAAVLISELANTIGTKKLFI